MLNLEESCKTNFVFPNKQLYINSLQNHMNIRHKIRSFYQVTILLIHQKMICSINYYEIITPPLKGGKLVLE